MYCSKITDLREKYLNPTAGFFQYLSPFTQLHGWWHLFAGYATYLHIINCIQQRLNFLKIDYSFRPSFFVGVNLELHPVQRLKLLKSKYYQDWILITWCKICKNAKLIYFVVVYLNKIVMVYDSVYYQKPSDKISSCYVLNQSRDNERRKN